MLDGVALTARLRARGLGAAAALTRFAPAPTGFLHLGHVVNAIFVWGLARALDGHVLLRIEDHDRQRCRLEYETALLDDLDWLGFAADSLVRQSERDVIYRNALATLIDRDLASPERVPLGRARRRVYGCDCSRQQLQASVYPGRCRDRGLPLDDGIGWRVRVDSRAESFDDGLLGVEHQSPSEQCGDILVRDRLGNWTYQWVAATDDTVQTVKLVIRGEDLLDSTGRQIYLARLLGRPEPPVYVHHPLIMKSPTQKLSKSDRDTGVRDLRAAGWNAPALIGHAAWLAGLQPSPTPVAAVDAHRLFIERSDAQ